MISQGDVISYLDMCKEEGVNLQRGMNFRLRGGHSVILMSLWPGAPYADRIEEEGRILIYEGHDIPAQKNGPHHKLVDQPEKNPGGGLTQNGLFYKAPLHFKSRKAEAELVKVYEKMRSGIWVYNGFFRLIDAWREEVNNRRVFKFKLELVDEMISDSQKLLSSLDHLRIIPTSVKLSVWRRDKGGCVMCGSKDIFTLITLSLIQKAAHRYFLKIFNFFVQGITLRNEIG